MEIASDLRSSLQDETPIPEPPKPIKIFLNKNNEFLEKEISFFISNLRNVLFRYKI